MIVNVYLPFRGKIPATRIRNGSRFETDCRIDSVTKPPLFPALRNCVSMKKPGLLLEISTHFQGNLSTAFGPVVFRLGMSIKLSDFFRFQSNVCEWCLLVHVINFTVLKLKKKNNNNNETKQKIKNGRLFSVKAEKN